MQTQQAILKNHSHLMRRVPSGGGIGWVTRLLGCWHKQMSRPFSKDGRAYRMCLDCGASRRFNTGSWEMTGEFYYAVPSHN